MSEGAGMDQGKVLRTLVSHAKKAESELKDLKISSGRLSREQKKQGEEVQDLLDSLTTVSRSLYVLYTMRMDDLRMLAENTKDEELRDEAREQLEVSFTMLAALDPDLFGHMFGRSPYTGDVLTERERAEFTAKINARGDGDTDDDQG